MGLYDHGKAYEAYGPELLLEFCLLDIEERSLMYWTWREEEDGITPPVRGTSPEFRRAKQKRAA